MIEDKEGVSSDLPKVGEVLKGIDLDQGDAKKKQDLFEQDFKQSSAAKEAEWIKIQAMHDHFKLKKEWSGFIKYTLVFLIGFQSVMLILVGVGFLDFTQYAWLVPTLLLQTLAQIIGKRQPNHLLHRSSTGLL